MKQRASHWQHGFTLIELVAVTVILGVLAAVGLPRMTALGSEGRIATINTTAGAMASAIAIAAAKCRLVTGCNVASFSVPVTGPQGLTGTMYNGYPTGQSRVPSYFGIKDWMSIQGVNVYELNTAVAEFRVDTAPDPVNCKVVYREAGTFGQTPTITKLTSGC